MNMNKYKGMKKRQLNEALIEAAKEGQLENVKELINLGANVKANNNSPLFESCYNGHTKTAEYLISQGAKV